MNEYGEWEYIWTNQYGLFSTAQTQNNVYIVTRYFREQGWTDNAIAAMCGNMWAESYVNPAQWEGSGPIGSFSHGFGLVQWTPRTKYSNWVQSMGGDWEDDYDWELFRITWEMQNGEQWIPVYDFDYMSFWEFSKSTEGLDYLTEAFLMSYERPGDPYATLDTRIRDATTCWNWINGGVPPYSGGAKKKKKKLILFMAKNNQPKNPKHWGGD